MVNAIRPKILPIIVNGRLMYSETSRANSIIRLKKEIISHFPQLRSNLKWNYQIEFWRTLEKTIEQIREEAVNTGNLPLLLYIYNENE